MAFESFESNELDHKHFGVYTGIVYNSNDPQMRGRVKLKIPDLLGEEVTGWAETFQPFGGGNNSGSCATPEETEGTVLCLVQFLHGSIEHPVVTGWLNSGNKSTIDTPSESAQICDGTKCSSCSDKKANSDTVKEHKEFHNHTSQFYCPKVKTVYKSPNGASIIVDERETVQKIKIVDQSGQSITFNCPKIIPTSIDLSALALNIQTLKLGFFNSPAVTKTPVIGNGNFSNVSAGGDHISLSDLNSKLGIVHVKLEAVIAALNLLGIM